MLGISIELFGGTPSPDTLPMAGSHLPWVAWNTCELEPIMNDDSLDPVVFGALMFVGALTAAGGATLVARYTYSTAGFLPLTLGDGALITWRIVAGWTSGWCGARIRRDLRTGSVVAYSAMIMAGIGGLVLWGGFSIQVDISPEQGANGLFLYAAFAFLCTLCVVVILYCCCLIYYRRKHGIPPA